MQSHIAIQHLEQYIKELLKKTTINTKMMPEMNILMDERIQSAMAQIELYKKGKGRLQNTWISA